MVDVVVVDCKLPMADISVSDVWYRNTYAKGMSSVSSIHPFVLKVNVVLPECPLDGLTVTEPPWGGEFNNNDMAAYPVLPPAVTVRVKVYVSPWVSTEGLMTRFFPISNVYVVVPCFSSRPLLAHDHLYDGVAPFSVVARPNMRMVESRLTLVTPCSAAGRLIETIGGRPATNSTVVLTDEAVRLPFDTTAENTKVPLGTVFAATVSVDSPEELIIALVSSCSPLTLKQLPILGCSAHDHTVAQLSEEASGSIPFARIETSLTTEDRLSPPTMRLEIGESFA